MELFTNVPGPTIPTINIPKLTNDVTQDILILRKQDKTTLLKMCESSTYVLDLCNKDNVLYQIINSP